MAQKPSNTPDWIPDNTTGIIIPGTSKQSAGWFKEERPPYQFFNWFWNIVSQFFHFLSGNVKHNIIIDTDANERDYTTLAAYIADSPTAGDRVLVKVDEEITGSTMVIPANISLEFLKGKKLWCDENLTTVLQFSNGVVTRGDLLLELSHTGTVTTAVSLNGNDNNHNDIILKNTTTGTITSAFKIESGKSGNLLNGGVLNPSGTVTRTFVDDSDDMTNLITVKGPDSNIYGTRTPRTATYNKADSPAPDHFGGGTVWVELRSSGTSGKILDESIDWRDRFIVVTGYAVEQATSRLPGQAGDNDLRANTDANATSAGNVLVNYFSGFLYTQQGCQGGILDTEKLEIESENGTQFGDIFALDSDGSLRWDSLSAPTNNHDIILKVDYSPKQKHYY